MQKKPLAILAASVTALMLFAGCTTSGNPPVTSSAPLDALQQLIQQAQGMTNQELFQKAIDESNGKTMYGIGNTSRGATAATSFIAELQKIDAMDDHLYTPGFAVQLALKDINLAAENATTPSSLFHVVQDRLHATVAAGHGKDDLAAVDYVRNPPPAA